MRGVRVGWRQLRSLRDLAESALKTDGCRLGTSTSAVARVPLCPFLIASQNFSRPAPKAETTPIPVIATRGWATVPIIASVRKTFAWIGAALFVVSLLSLPAVYERRLITPRPDGDGSLALALLSNIALFTGFALHHSVMARSGAKAWINRIVPPELERSVYVWIASLLFLAVCWLWQPLPGMVWNADGPLRWGLRAIQLAGVWLTIRAAGMIDVFDLAGVRQANHQRPVEFRVAGPFG